MLADFLLEMTVKTSVVLALAVVATRLMAAWSSAAARHLVWVAAVAGTLVLPALMLFGPTWRVSLVPGAWTASANAVMQLSRQASRSFTSGEVWPTAAPVASHAPADKSQRSPAEPNGGGASPSVDSGGTLAWSFLLGSIWAVGAAFALIRLLIGLGWAHWIVRRAIPVVAPDWLALQDDAANLIGSPRNVPLRMSDRVGVPVACGILRPALLVPFQAESWDGERRKVVLLHELAHVKRRDCLVQALAQLALALHWFNPLAYAAVARLRAEQERACDDLVLKAGTPGSDYADHLCEIVRTARAVRTPAWATLAVARPSRLDERVRAILDVRLSRRVPSRRLSVASSALACVGVVFLGAVHPPAAMDALETMTLLPSAALDRIGPYASLVDQPRPLSLDNGAADVAQAAAPAFAAPGAPMRPGVQLDDDAARDFLASYGTTCHNDQRRSAGISLTAFSVAGVSQDTDLGERIVRKLRSRVHPPRGVARPEAVVSDAFSSGLENALDRADQTNWNPGLVQSLSSPELASRLSTFLWNGDPDAELLKAAESGRLQNPTELERQARRMLADHRSSGLVTKFFGQWLFIDNLAKVKRDFSALDPDLPDLYRREVDLFLASQIHDDRSIVDLLTANYSFVNDRLAGVYGMAGVNGSQFRRVSLSDETRFGLLGKAGILALTSYPHRTSPIVRGKYVLETFLGVAVPAPPPNVPALEENKPGEAPESVRQRLENHARNPVCSACHSTFDPFGFALENFDNFGRWRNADGTPIDASAELPDGTRFTGPAGLRSVLVDRQEMFASALTLRLLAYSLGRTARYADMPTVRAIVWDTAPGRYRWSSLVVAIVNSRPFQTKPIAD